MKRFAVSMLVAAVLVCGASTSVFAQKEDSSAYSQKQTMTAESDSSELLGVLTDHQQYSTLVDALKKTGLHQSLGEGPYTLFAPTDSAFKALRRPVSEMSADELADVLRNHILLKSYTVEQLAKQSQVQNVHGTNLRIGKQGPSIERAQVTEPNVEVGNSIVHGVNSVITLQARSAAATADTTES